jgi:hypothetical protein
MIIDDEDTAARTTSRLGQHIGDFNMERLRAPSPTKQDSMKVSSSGGLQ